MQQIKFRMNIIFLRLNNLGTLDIEKADSLGFKTRLFKFTDTFMQPK